MFRIATTLTSGLGDCDAYTRHALSALGIQEGVRISACHYNSPQEVDALLAAPREVTR